MSNSKDLRFTINDLKHAIDLALRAETTVSITTLWLCHDLYAAVKDGDVDLALAVIRRHSSSGKPTL